MEESSNKTKEQICKDCFCMGYKWLTQATKTCEKFNQECDMILPEKPTEIEVVTCNQCIFSGLVYGNDCLDIEKGFCCGKISKNIASPIHKSVACDSFLSNSEVWDQLNKKSDKKEKKRFPVKTTDTIWGN